MSVAKAKKQSRQSKKDAVVLAAARHVAFDGWGTAALARGAVDAGFDAKTAKDLFPNGQIDAIAHLAVVADHAMVEAMEKADMETMRVRDRVIFGVRARLEFLTPYREAVRRGLGILMLPTHAVLMVRIVHATVDKIWRQSGDHAVDFNFYTERGLLAAVYVPVVLFWLGDHSENFEDTWDFLARRIDDVLKIPALKMKFEKAMQGIWEKRPNAKGSNARMRP